MRSISFPPGPFLQEQNTKARNKTKKMAERPMNVRFHCPRSLATAGIVALALPLAAQATNITFTDAVLMRMWSRTTTARTAPPRTARSAEAEALPGRQSMSAAVRHDCGAERNQDEIASFADIANFPNLDTPRLLRQPVHDARRPKNTSLTYLGCGHNQPTSLDVRRTRRSSSPQLRRQPAQCRLDVSKNTSLTELHCSYIGLTVLDVSKNTSLTLPDCSGNQLTSLDIRRTRRSRCSSAPAISIALDVSKNTKLTYLYCDNNKLTSLDVRRTHRP